MVLIHTRPTDETTLEIIQWLCYYKKEFRRLNSVNDLIELNISLKKFSSFYFNGKGSIIPNVTDQPGDLNEQLRDYLQNQADTVLEHLIANFADHGFGHSPFGQRRINKLEALKLASSLGFEIPLTEIVTSKKRLEELKGTWGRIITKSVDSGISVNTKTILIDGQKTEEVTSEVINQMAETFFPSLIQQLIPKAYEVRVFYFRERFYSLATFTQKNELSQIDGRAIDPRRPNRQVPYEISGECQARITSLMKKLELNYGSLDFIYTPEGRNVFLEVNPYGQFGFLSKAGNYHIEKQIAEYL